MPVDWTPHRFSGGVLALDAANTVVHRNNPAKRFDRFDDPREIARFAEAASAFRVSEIGPHGLEVADAAAIKPGVLALREATDALFRDASASGGLHAPKLETLLRAAANGVSGYSGRFSGERSAGDAEPVAFEAALGFSALTLLQAESWRRIRICPACAWLFLDESRNGSRRWCDMAVCGNRHKARLHYSKVRRNGGEDVQHDG